MMTYNPRTSPLFYNSGISTFIGTVYTENFVFINNYNNGYFAISSQNYNSCSNTNTCNTRSLSKVLLFVPTYNSVRFGRKSIIHPSILSWNYLQSILDDYELLNCLAKYLRNLLTKYLISKCDKE